MKRLPSVVVPVLLLLTFSVIIFFNDTVRAQTQSGGAVTPNASGSVAAQTGESIEAQRRLQCQNCHGPGKTLPYLGGSLFHADEHRAYDSGFHAQAHQNGGGVGKRAATCVDCHTKDGTGDLTTMLPKSDPASPVARANLADTCGRCHGDANVMQGSGITTRPFLSFRESVHAQAA
jgi:cytochrome c553